ncbi:20357_t:CDS:2, partial [Racocetra persica]
STGASNLAEMSKNTTHISAMVRCKEEDKKIVVSYIGHNMDNKF